jgi:hypothetical protein
MKSAKTPEQLEPAVRAETIETGILKKQSV